MSVSRTEVPEQSEEVREKRDRIVEEAVERATRRMGADEREQEVLEEAAERLAERVTRPVVDSVEGDSGRDETAVGLFLG